MTPKIEQWMSDAAWEIYTASKGEIKPDWIQKVIGSHALREAAGGVMPNEVARALLLRIWEDWKVYDRTKANFWNPSVGLFQDVKEWAEAEIALDSHATSASSEICEKCGQEVVAHRLNSLGASSK